jgi:hypothetical protein
MMEQKLAAGVSQLLGNMDPATLKDAEVRQKRTRYTFAASQFALGGACPCEACHLLRLAIQGDLNDIRKEAGLIADSNHPQPHGDAPVVGSEQRGAGSADPVPAVAAAPAAADPA